MKKITNGAYNYADNLELINMLIDNQNDIIDWINEQKKVEEE